MTGVLSPELQLGPREFLASPRARERACSLEEAQAYTRWLATAHYENFHVVSWFLPKRLHQDFFNVYAYCRWADDLGDEIGAADESLRLLDWWGGELDRMFAGEVTHPVFIALRGTVRAHSIPREPFADLIGAFIQDQTVSRYLDWPDLLRYCERSANPVGRLILYLGGYSDPERQRLSDATCSGLQLANFWQDVTVDLEKNRVYIPLNVLERNDCPLDDVLARRFTPAFRRAMIECVDRADALFAAGLPLVHAVDRRLSLDIDLFNRGGMVILEKIRRLDYNVLAGRPRISKPERAGLLLRALARFALRPS